MNDTKSRYIVCNLPRRFFYSPCAARSVTFFAVPDKALKPPPKHHGPPHGEHPPPEDLQWEALYERASNPQSDLFEDIPLLEAFVDAHQLDKDHSGDDDKKKEIFKAIVTAILSYHILPEYLTVDDLSKNSTFATSLTINDGSLDGNAQRIRVLTYPRVIQPLLIVNFRSKIIVPDVKAKNGKLDPVFPPLTNSYHSQALSMSSTIPFSLRLLPSKVYSCSKTCFLLSYVSSLNY